MYIWESATVGALGGPLLVCEFDPFSDWGGAVHGPDYEPNPACDFARALSAVHPDDDDLEAAFARFGDHEKHVGLIWETDREGSAKIAYARYQNAPYGDDDNFLIMRSWVPRTDAPRRRAAGVSAAEEQEVGELELRSVRVVVVWAAVMAHETGLYATWQERAASLDALARLNPPVQLNLDHQLGLGTVLWVKSGTYRATWGLDEGTRGRYLPEEEMYKPPQPNADDDWSCRRVRFTRSGESLEA